MPQKSTARDFRAKLCKCIWVGARQLKMSEDILRNIAADIANRPEITGEEGSTLSKCTLGELVSIAYKIKKAGANIWVPAIPRGALLHAATPWQMDKIQKFFKTQTYLNDPIEFFKKRLQVNDPLNPSFHEAVRMLGFIGNKERSNAPE